MVERTLPLRRVWSVPGGSAMEGILSLRGPRSVPVAQPPLLQGYMWRSGQWPSSSRGSPDRKQPAWLACILVVSWQGPMPHAVGPVHPAVIHPQARRPDRGPVMGPGEARWSRAGGPS